MNIKEILKKQSIKDLIFNPLLYTEYPYHWNEYDENGKITNIVFSKKPRYTLLEYIDLKNKIENCKKKLGWLDEQ